MNQPIPTGPDLFGFAVLNNEKARSHAYGTAEESYHLDQAVLHSQQAQTAAIVMLAEVIANATGTDHPDLDGWREKIGLTWLKECKSKDRRRPQCEERHTEDCAYADPPPEPKHELLSVGTRVLVSDWLRDNDDNVRFQNPQPGKITGYDIGRTKYRWRFEFSPGHYSTHDLWAFVDNRVTVHPDGPECPPDPREVKPPTVDAAKVQRLFQRRWVCGVSASGYHNGSDCGPEEPHDGWGCGYHWTVPPINDDMASKLGLDGSVPPQEPTGPVLYVERFTGKQGRVLELVNSDGTVRGRVQWFEPGAEPVWVDMNVLKIIASDQVDRCPNGQTRDECGSGENQCELCLADEDTEAEDTERSMGQ